MAITGWGNFRPLPLPLRPRGDRGHDRIRRSVPPSTAKVTDADRKGVSASYSLSPCSSGSGGKPWPLLHACDLAYAMEPGAPPARAPPRSPWPRRQRREPQASLWITSIPRSSSSSVMLLTPPEYSTRISLGTKSAQIFM